MTIEREIEDLRQRVKEELCEIQTVTELDSLKVAYLGKKGAVAALMASLRHSSDEERPKMGQLVNTCKEELIAAFSTLQSQLEKRELDDRLEREAIDVTRPGRPLRVGKKHILMQVLDEAIEIFLSLGFSVQYGPDIESDFYNFEALNFGKDHPARDMQDTFYISPQNLLRTHTSNTQVRVMESSSLPLRFIAPGRCFRKEDVTARSHVVFHQIEGVYIDEHVHFGDLIGCVEQFFPMLFKRKIEMRYRPSYFPFVEPGMEIDIRCIVCEGVGCTVCKHTGWLEVMGAGMIHPEVLKNGGIDPEKYTGYAFGFGIERVAMLRHSIKDIRYFFTNRLAFLSQF
jgi:phenylalanyl-tRNA synthetase alpha chain